jgi:hypothetical protein
MHKAVALISQFEELKKAANDINTLLKHKEEKYGFLKKQVEDIDRQVEEGLEAAKSDAMRCLDEQGLLPEWFNPQKHHIHINPDLGTVVACDGDHRQPNLHSVLMSFLKQ